MIERVRDYRHKLVVLRQIMSNKARRYGRLNTAMKIVTVFISSLLTFMGFTGIDNLSNYLSWFVSLTQEQVQLVFNLGVLGLFIVVILYLVFRFSEREAEASKAIVSITHLKNSVDDLLLKTERGRHVTEVDLQLVSDKYEMLIEVLPSNSDREYKKALREVPVKQVAKLTLQLAAQDLFIPRHQEEVLREIILKSDSIMQVLETLRTTDERLYLGGGVVRNAVWDYLHGYPSPTPPDDVDVTYFDSARTDKSEDKELERKLAQADPNVTWSVKNQARMHLVNAESAYSSLEDAISKWPETATAILVRKSHGGSIEIIAPCGLDDLFRMVVRPTPHFKAKLDRYQDRLEKKRWERHWPRLVFLDRK